jgi:hypothetical protein
MPQTHKQDEGRDREHPIRRIELRVGRLDPCRKHRQGDPLDDARKRQISWGKLALEARRRSRVLVSGPCAALFPVTKCANAIPSAPIEQARVAERIER